MSRCVRAQPTSAPRTAMLPTVRVTGTVSCIKVAQLRQEVAKPRERPKETIDGSAIRQLSCDVTAKPPRSVQHDHLQTDVKNLVQQRQHDVLQH